MQGLRFGLSLCPRLCLGLPSLLSMGLRPRLPTLRLVLPYRQGGCVSPCWDCVLGYCRSCSRPETVSQVTVAALSTALQAGKCLCWGSSAKKIKLMFTSVLTKLFITFAKNLHPRFRGNDLCACLEGNTERSGHNPWRSLGWWDTQYLCLEGSTK